jgi:hypothetical protein
MLRAALGIPRPDPSPRPEDPDLDPVWRLGGCSQPFDVVQRGEVRLALPDGWRSVAGPSLTPGDGPWRVAASSNESTRSFFVAMPRGRFDEPTCARRDEELSALERILHQPIVVLGPPAPESQPGRSP